MTNRFKDILSGLGFEDKFLRQKFRVNTGDSLVFDVFVADPNDPSQPLDLTGSTINMVLVNGKVDPTITITKTVGDGITLVSGELGHIMVRLEAADTLAFSKYGGVVHYDVKITDTFNNVFSASYGELILTQDFA